MGERNKKYIREQEMTFDKDFKSFFDTIWTKYKSITT